MDLKEIKEKAKSGSVVSQGILGHNYLWGIGTAPNYEEALKWIALAAEKGVSQALFNLGYMYENGLGVQKDEIKAIEYYEKSVKRGNIDGYLALGVIYSNGVNADKQKSETYFVEALKIGDGDASRIAYKFLKGYGLPKNLKYAYLWYNIDLKRSAKMIEDIKSLIDEFELKNAESLLNEIK